MTGQELLERYVVVEGHRDVYELLYRCSIGEQTPLRDAIAPRLTQNGVNICVYAISGDSYSHSQNTGRYLETALKSGPSPTCRIRFVRGTSPLFFTSKGGCRFRGASIS